MSTKRPGELIEDGGLAAEDAERRIMMLATG